MHLCFPLAGPASGAHGSLVGQQSWHLGHGAQGIISGRPWGYIDSLRLGLCLVADPANGGGEWVLVESRVLQAACQGLPPHFRAQVAPALRPPQPLSRAMF